MPVQAVSNTPASTPTTAPAVDTVKDPVLPVPSPGQSTTAPVIPTKFEKGIALNSEQKEKVADIISANREKLTFWNTSPGEEPGPTDRLRALNLAYTKQPNYPTEQDREKILTQIGSAMGISEKEAKKLEVDIYSPAGVTVTRRFSTAEGVQSEQFVIKGSNSDKQEIQYSRNNASGTAETKNFARTVNDEITKNKLAAEQGAEMAKRVNAFVEKNQKQLLTLTDKDTAGNYVISDAESARLKQELGAAISLKKVAGTGMTFVDSSKIPDDMKSQIPKETKYLLALVDKDGNVAYGAFLSKSMEVLRQELPKNPEK